MSWHSFRIGVATAALAILTAGCADQGSSPAAKAALAPAPAAMPAARVATITIYRPDFDFGSGSNPTVSINGVEVVTPRRGTTFATRLLPGLYRFEVDGDRAGELRASAGQTYVFQLILQRGRFSGHGRLGIVSPAQARDEVEHLTPIDKDDIESAAFR